MVYWNGGLYPYPYFFSGYPIYTGDVDPWLFGPDDYDQDQSSMGYGSAGSDGSGGSDGSTASDGSAGDYGEDGSGYPQSPYAPDPGYAGQYGMGQPASPQYAPGGARQSAPARQPYTGSAPENRPDSQQPQGSSVGSNSAAVTVIFKDGRPPEHIRNYLLTADTLTVFEPHYRQIPLGQVDMAATVAANEEAGVDFRVPGR